MRKISCDAKASFAMASISGASGKAKMMAGVKFLASLTRRELHAKSIRLVPVPGKADTYAAPWRGNAIVFRLEGRWHFHVEDIFPWRMFLASSDHDKGSGRVPGIERIESNLHSLLDTVEAIRLGVVECLAECKVMR